MQTSEGIVTIVTIEVLVGKSETTFIICLNNHRKNTKSEKCRIYFNETEN